MPYAERMVVRAAEKSRIAGAALVAAVWLALLIAPGSASAVIWLQGAGNQVYVSAAVPGPEDDEVIVSAEVGPPAMYVFTDPAGVTAWSPCVLRSPTEGACPAIGRVKMTVSLANGTNSFSAELSDAGEGFSLRNVFVNAGRSRDVIDLRGLPPGTPFAQVLSGRGPDLVIGGPARIDRMNGAFGNDRLVGSSGRDVQIGGPGNDVLVGRAGRDRQTGGSGKDKLNGGAGPDILDAGSGADLLIGGASFDQLLGGGGFDRALAPVSRAEQRRASSVERFR